MLDISDLKILMQINPLVLELKNYVRACSVYDDTRYFLAIYPTKSHMAFVPKRNSNNFLYR